MSESKASDGKLSPTSSLSAEQMHVLRRTKIKVLEIVWAYLYSGREQQAWRELAAMWPASDFDRIRSAILNARKDGIESQLDGASVSPSSRKESAYIYETADENTGGRIKDPMEPRFLRLYANVKPHEILLRRSEVAGGIPLPRSVDTVELVIDAAGKVRSAKPIGAKNIDLVDDCAGWKFIPAFRDGRPVASRMKLSVYYLR